MTIDLVREADTPLYRQIHATLAGRIRSGQLKPGTRLPSVRNLAKRLGVSLITVVQAYDALAAEGLVHASVGRGTFIGSPSSQARAGGGLVPEQQTTTPPEDTEWQTSLPVYLRAPRLATMQTMLKPARRQDIISLAGGTPDPTLFPVRALGRMWHRAMVVEDPKCLQYGMPQGDSNLRGWIAGYFAALGVPAGPNDILITSGSQQAIDLVARTFVGPGDYVLVESPTFLTALDIFEARGAKLLGVPVDARGMRVDIAATLVERFRPRVIYTIPTAHNPTGTTMIEERRRRLMDLARHHNLIVIEDDTTSDFAYDGDPPSAVKVFDSGGHVIFIKSFSKTVIPGLRVAGVVAHGPIMKRLVESKSVVDRFTSPLIQRTLWRYLSSRQYDRDLEDARNTYRKRRDVVLRTLEAEMTPDVTWTHPTAGFNMWLNLPSAVSAREAFEEGIKDGIACGFGDLFLPHVPPPSGLRISFADKPEPMLVEGIRRLARALGRLTSPDRTRPQEPEFVTTV